MKTLAYIIIVSLAIFVIAGMIVGLRGVYHCSVCGKVYLGKQESIHNRPACDECYEAYYVEQYGKEQK